jgi:hypothetical protein
VLRSEGRIAGSGAGHSPEEAFRVALDLMRVLPQDGHTLRPGASGR